MTKETANATTDAAIINDIILCEVGMAFTKGKRRKAFKDHRAACFAEMKRMNERDGMNNMSDDELLAELMG